MARSFQQSRSFVKSDSRIQASRVADPRFHTGVSASDPSAISASIPEENLRFLPTPDMFDVWQDRFEEHARYVQENPLSTRTDDGFEEQRVVGCIVRLDRGFPAVLHQGGVVRAEFSAELAKGDRGTFESVATIGDWVALRIPYTHDMAIIEGVLPRTHVVTRWKKNNRARTQLLAANINRIALIYSLARSEGHYERLVRGAISALEAGLPYLVILTKADLLSDVELMHELEAIRALVGAEVDIVVTSAHESLQQLSHSYDGRVYVGLDGLMSCVSPHELVLLLGESGAGKSSLMNALLEEEVLSVGSLRISDGSGRHTTVARRMIAAPRGQIFIDVPGLRKLELVGHEEGLKRFFSDVHQAASQCRFRDCTHHHEPDCAVRLALHEGALSEVRVATYMSLAEEMRSNYAVLDPDAAYATRRRKRM